MSNISSMYKDYLKRWSNLHKLGWVNKKGNNSFLDFLVEHSSVKELTTMFSYHKTIHCCDYHSGKCPISIDSHVVTPSKYGVRCMNSNREILRTLRNAYVMITHNMDDIMNISEISLLLLPDQ